MSEKDRERSGEQRRVDFVVGEIIRKISILKEKTGDLKDRIVNFRRSFWDEVTVNLDEPDDVIETQASLRQQSELLSERERSHGLMSEELKTLERLKDNPYFGRIDFEEEGIEGTEEIYIGIASLMDEKDEDFLIYDWRAPISSLYYDYPPGNAEYKTPEGKIGGEIKLKRQFIIRNGDIKGQFDTGITIGDRLLQQMLGGNASTSMKSIVATIQREQNRIIRNEKTRLLKVQGVAGSGKTSAALQRVAYLLYAHRETLAADNILLFSPNPLFNSYVSTVLPELGENNMQQTTFKEYAEDQIKEGWRIEDPFEQMEAYLDPGTSSARIKGMKVKASGAFKDTVDRYLKRLNDDGLVFRPVVFRGQELFSAEGVAFYFYHLDEKLPLSVRLEKTSEWLLDEIAAQEKKERTSDWADEEAQLLSKDEQQKIYDKLQDSRRFTEESFDDFDREQRLARALVVRRTFRPLIQWIQKGGFLDTAETYKRLFGSAHHDLSQETMWPSIAADTLEALNRDLIYWEDVTSYLYFKDAVTGRRAYRQIRHVFLDEAQDYSPFQFAYMRQLFPSAKMTLLGDLNQSIYAHALEGPSVLAEEGEEKEEVIRLTRSYRSTKEITEFTKTFLPGGEAIEAFNREGAKPQVIRVPAGTDYFDLINEKITNLQEKGHKTIAVICKTLPESRDTYEKLKEFRSLTLVDQDTYTFEQGILVMPAYLAKGIEFDAVIMADASAENYGREAERLLFYTACTRAMHELTLFIPGTSSPFIEEAPEDTYTQIHSRLIHPKKS